RNQHHPLLERLRFLSISAANLDEFFMVRVAGLEGQVREGIVQRSPDGRTPEQQLQQIVREAGELQREQQESLSMLLEELAREKIRIVNPRHLSKAELAWIEKHFRDQIFPVLTP